MRPSRLALVGLVAVVAAAGCGSSTAPASSSGTGASASSGATANPGVPSGITVDSFTTDIASTMSQFKSLAKYAMQGKSGLLIGVILPDTTSSVRWQDFDQPYLNAAFADAGFSQSQFRIDNALGSDTTEIDDAQADINLGAKVLVVCMLDGPTGSSIAQLAESKGVKVVSYDRAIFYGTSTYYVSFDNFKVGQLIGQGFSDCVTAENVTNPQIFILDGGKDTDPNAVSFANGYDSVIFNQQPGTKELQAGLTNSKGWKLVGNQYAPGWDNTKGGTIFQQAFTANPQINAVVTANDGLGNAVITDLKADGVPAGKVPVTGQDGTAQGMAWILEGYQCGSVYKAVYKEAQDAASLAIILLSGNTVPPALLNSTTTDPADASITEPASLLTPVWVTKANMESTVVKDGFDTASAICAIAGQSLCTANNIS